MPKYCFECMLKNRKKFIEVGFQILSESCHYWYCGEAPVSSGYSVGHLPRMNVTPFVGTAQEKVLLTVSDTKSLSASQQGFQHTPFIKKYEDI